MHPATFSLFTAVALASGIPLVRAESPPVIGEVSSTAGTSSSGLLEDEPIGLWNQPAWVKHRRFSTTRVHIQRDPGEVAVEQWWRGRLSGGKWKHLFQEEVEIGLPGRIQLDFYEDWVIEDGEASHKDFAAEIRYGLADWGAIPGNPALYLEYKWTDPDHGGDVIEPKILFGDDFGQGWHWGLNFVYERELTGEKTEEWAVAGALSKTIIDETFSLGMEWKYTRETVSGGRSEPEHKFIIGPSLQWRPTARTHLDLVGLAGVTSESPDIEAWAIFGIDFGGSGDGRRGAVSARR